MATRCSSPPTCQSPWRPRCLSCATIHSATWLRSLRSPKTTCCWLCIPRREFLADLIAAAKARPGALTFASAGKASPSHLCAEMLKRQADIDMTHVPYSGAAPAMNAVLAGDVTMYCAPIPVGMAHFTASKVYALGVTGTAPSPLVPDLAPLSAIYSELVISPWLALFAPVATPPAVTQLVRDELKKAYADPDLQQKLAALALEPAWLSSAELSQRIEADTAKWMDLFKSAGDKAE